MPKKRNEGMYFTRHIKKYSVNDRNTMDERIFSLFNESSMSLLEVIGKPPSKQQT